MACKWPKWGSQCVAIASKELPVILINRCVKGSYICISQITWNNDVTQNSVHQRLTNQNSFCKEYCYWCILLTLLHKWKIRQTEILRSYLKSITSNNSIMVPKICSVSKMPHITKIILIAHMDNFWKYSDVKTCF